MVGSRAAVADEARATRAVATAAVVMGLAVGLVVEAAASPEAATEEVAANRQ